MSGGGGDEVNNNKQAVLEFIHTSCQGRKHAMTARSLSRVLGIPEREVREIVSELRRERHPIASAVNPPYGFYIPKNMQEAKECRQHLYSRITQLKKTAKAFDAAIDGSFDKQVKQLELSL